jgi:hypothetical protein
VNLKHNNNVHPRNGSLNAPQLRSRKTPTPITVTSREDSDESGDDDEESEE